jgi:hypothetical protein
LDSLKLDTRNSSFQYEGLGHRASQFRSYVAPGPLNRPKEKSYASWTKRIPPALKHGAYSEVTLLPGEDPDEFAELHRGLIAEFAPNGRMAEETVATIARLVWRRQNLAQFQIGQLSNYMIEAIKEGTKKLDERGVSNVVSDLNKMVERASG